MRHHTRAAILLGGWLLVEPPLDFGAKPVPPLTQWTVVRAFDTAEHCEAFKSGGLEEMTRQRAAKDVPPEQRPEIPEARRVIEAGRCVPAETIYPPKTPAQK